MCAMSCSDKHGYYVTKTLPVWESYEVDLTQVTSIYIYIYLKSTSDTGTRVSVNTRVSTCVWSKSGIKHPYFLLTLFQTHLDPSASNICMYVHVE